MSMVYLLNHTKEFINNYKTVVRTYSQLTSTSHSITPSNKNIEAIDKILHTLHQHTLEAEATADNAGEGGEARAAAAAAAVASATAAAAALSSRAKKKASKAASSSSATITTPPPVSPTTECQVCYSPFDSTLSAFQLSACNHAQLCTDCFRSYLESKIHSNDFAPYLRCPTVGCKAAIEMKDVVTRSGLEVKVLYEFALRQMKSLLARTNRWVFCRGGEEAESNEKSAESSANSTSSTDSDVSMEKKSPNTASSTSSSSQGKGDVTSLHGCQFGFQVDPVKPAVVSKKCDVCGVKQEVKRIEVELDDSLKQLISAGNLRPCPSCSELQMKDVGMCNVMTCHRCQTVWNWRTSEVGTSYSQMKEKARRNGSMWEAGELEYQRQLQETDLPKFIELLKKNGIDYDPNFVRGAS